MWAITTCGASSGLPNIEDQRTIIDGETLATKARPWAHHCIGVVDQNKKTRKNNGGHLTRYAFLHFIFIPMDKWMLLVEMRVHNSLQTVFFVSVFAISFTVVDVKTSRVFE